MAKSREPEESRNRTHLIRYEDLQPGDELDLGPEDRIVLPVRTIREAVGDVDEVELINPDGAMTIYLEMMEIFGQGAVGATATQLEREKSGEDHRVSQPGGTPNIHSEKDNNRLSY